MLVTHSRLVRDELRLGWRAEKQQRTATKTQFSSRLLSVEDFTDALTSFQISFNVFKCYQTMF